MTAVVNAGSCVNIDQSGAFYYLPFTIELLIVTSWFKENVILLIQFEKKQQFFFCQHSS